MKTPQTIKRRCARAFACAKKKAHHIKRAYHGEVYLGWCSDHPFKIVLIERPLGTDELPSTADEPLLGTDKLPSTAEGPPLGTDELPSTADGLLLGTDKLPSTAEGPPLGTGELPSTAHGPPPYSIADKADVFRRFEPQEIVRCLNDSAQTFSDISQALSGSMRYGEMATRLNESVRRTQEMRAWELSELA